MGWPSVNKMVRLDQARHPTVIVLAVPTGAPVRSRVVEPVGLPPCTESAFQSSVVLPVGFVSAGPACWRRPWVSSVPRAAVGSAKSMPMMDSARSQAALRSRRAATARDSPTIRRHAPPPIRTM